MSGVITAPEELTPARLTQLLRRAGVLQKGSVSKVAVGANPAFNSAISHLQIQYSPGASLAAPTTLVLKRNLPEQWAREAGAAEVAFYTEAQSLSDDPPMLVPCYDAAYDTETGDSHLLLLDVSVSHEPLVTRENLIALGGVPADERLAAAVRAIARLHAHWWEHPSLFDGSREVSAWYGTRERFDARAEQRRREWEAFQTGPGTSLPADLQALYQRALDRLPLLWGRGLGERVTSRRNLTLVHGDCFLSQFLYPRSGRGPTYLVDWQDTLADLPALDLTHLFATFWTPEQRHEGDRERRLLKQYRDALAAAGGVDYGWELLTWDYRVLLIFMILQPVWDAVNGTSEAYWRPKMHCLTSAYRDWACEELLA